MIFKKGKTFQRGLAWLLGLAMALTALPLTTLAANDSAVAATVATPREQSAGLTREQARDLLYTAASRYRDGLSPEDILGDAADGSLAEIQAVTRLEALVMLSRAFGNLPEPKGDFLRAAAESPVYTDVPDWAEPYVAALASARVLLPTEDAQLHGDDPKWDGFCGQYFCTPKILWKASLTFWFSCAIL
jgi:putative endopeptidase